MNPVLRKAAAFIRRDFQIESSYKTNFLMSVVDSMMILVFFYFLSELIARGESRSRCGCSRNRFGRLSSAVASKRC
jgi:hypothetical protein